MASDLIAPRPVWRYPRIVVHRGAGIFSPENTLAALRFSANAGYRGVEVDAMLAADAVPVLTHDSMLGRTVKGVGDVASMSSSELAQLDAGLGEPVPTLTSAMTFCREQHLWMNIEIKPSDHEVAYMTGRVVGSLAKAAYIDQLGTEQAPLLSSFSLPALLGARESAPELVRGLLVNDIPNDYLELMKETAASTLHVNEHHLTQEQVNEITQAAIPIMVYTVNDTDAARRLFDWGVSAICTDRPDAVHERLHDIHHL